MKLFPSSGTALVKSATFRSASGPSNESAARRLRKASAAGPSGVSATSRYRVRLLRFLFECGACPSSFASGIAANTGRPSVVSAWSTVLIERSIASAPNTNIKPAARPPSRPSASAFVLLGLTGTRGRGECSITLTALVFTSLERLVSLIWRSTLS